MKNIFKPRMTISAVEIEVANLEKRRAEIVRRIGDAEHALEQAREERREILSTTGDFDGVTKRVSEIANQLADLKVVLIDVDAQGADALARLTKARDAETRAASAAALEKLALAAESRLPEIEKSVAALVKAIMGLKADLGDDTGFFPSYNTTRPDGSIDERKDKATSREVIAAIVAEVLARAAPWMFDVASNRDGYRSGLFRVMDPTAFQPSWTSHYPTDALSAAEIVQALVLGPLRERASAIRAGDVAVERPAPSTVDDVYVRAVMPPNVSVFVIQSFSYFGTEFGPPMLCGEGWTQSVPLPVAKLAEAQDLAVRATSARGEALIAAARNRKGNSETRVRPEDCVELADVMGLRTSLKEVSRQAVAS